MSPLMIRYHVTSEQAPILNNSTSFFKKKKKKTLLFLRS
ncbi:hypothetical protein NC653_011354 [Populus alba x Populus x berolinensis]|uniref:Uncharacterized protein n=1 Tax=Populus alba x Populus x berolinensis TaxID=444605 RepID=A0AAD6R299_9ROSI|nr:hypothetical protein NC653_011354 [Populus alba x Populus x berolinensis]